jgi:hypothetical protein
VDTEILVIEQKEAGVEFLRNFSKDFPVDAAFWLKETDIEDWYLYIVSSEITNENMSEAYRKVLELVKPNQSIWLDPFRVKLLDSEKELAKRVLEVKSRFVGAMATYYNASSIAGVPIDACFIYQNIEQKLPLETEKLL